MVPVGQPRVTGRRQVSLGDEITLHDQRFRLVSTTANAAETTLIATPGPGSDSLLPRPAEKDTADTEGTRMLSDREVKHIAQRATTPPARDFQDQGNGPRLVILTAPIRGKIISLKHPLPDFHWSIGRSADSDILLEDQTISAEHALINQTASGWLLTSTHARNAMLVNGKPTQRAFLRHNDRVRLGRLELCFKLDETTQPARAKTHSKQSRKAYWVTALAILLALVAIPVIHFFLTKT